MKLLYIIFSLFLGTGMASESNPIINKKGNSGYVTFKMDINEEGKPFNIKIIKSFPKGLFEKTATRAVKKWTFKPKIINGKKFIQKNILYTMEFKLEE